ncbi:glycoside hydrolase family 127 protein [Shewanella sp. Isolate11]|uniref:glycoside hydrolase family 127 protein n=1 Tax=Shewanella sp. Isolate11 TaxID=2908530 RepID=UPI001EFDEA86|nr:glycoside hydrolase family 127 protein [Shewanella sp. Isolate11]MCG9696623.1 glycoside hydrolase family 127 protein [Shewanella sp. Isolate11]
MKRLLTAAALMLNSSIALALQPTPVPLQDVRITDGPFLHAQQTDLHYLMVMDPERLLAPYRKEAGLPSDAPNYPNWEDTGLDGHIGGHYLSALSLMYASTGDSKVLERLNYMVEELNKCQQANGNGYVGGVPNGAKLWKSIAEGDIRADLFTLNEAWVPWYNVHKVFAGLKDAYIYTGNEQAKKMMVLFSDWMLELSKNLSDQQLQLMLRTEYGGLNETLADVYDITGNKAYLTLAKRYTDLSVLNPLLEHKDALTGLHANTQIPKIVGVARIAQLEHNKDWHDSADFFWQTIVNHRTVSIGGNSVREHFHPSNDFSSMLESVEGPETCNTYNMLKLSKLLYEGNGDLNYIDYYERALYNHILSSQNPETGGLVYFTAMRPNQYRVYSDPQKSMWCCVGSGIENHAKYGEMIYAQEQDQLFVNLFIDSTLNWQSKQVKLKQTTQFPDTNTSEIEILSSAKFGLNLRYPVWVDAGELTVNVNGKTQNITAKPGEYVQLERQWQAGDKVTITLPMNISLEQMPDKSAYYSVLYGPIVLAAKTNPFPNEQINFVADDSRMGHIAKGPTCEPENAPVFISDGTQFLKDIKKVPSSTLAFTTGNAKLNLGEKLELIPFFRLHDSRYSVYFGQSSTDNWQSLQARLAAQSKQAAELAASTLDLVQPGEQQPESDHFFEASRSEAGLNGTRHWRHAHDWFSYQLNAKGETQPVLRLTFFGLDNNREFDILIDKKYLATVKLTGDKGPDYFTEAFPIPAKLLKDTTQPFRVKFKAKPGSIAGGLYEVRLMKPEEK